MKSEIDEIVNVITKIDDLIKNKNGQKINLSKEKIFIRGPFLHQDTENMSEEESAAFERNNQELFNFLRALDDEIRDI